MWEHIEQRLNDLARRAGLSGVPTVAVAAVAVVLGAAVVAGLWRWWPREAAVAPAAGVAKVEAASDKSAGRAAASAGGPTTGTAGAAGSALVTVHVVGAVLRPGVYELPATSRVRDAVNAAGGLSGNAAQASVNLARPLTDGEQISFPTQDEYAKAGADAQNLSGAGISVASPGGAPAENPGAPTAGVVVNINTADAGALDALPGVGPSTAAKIVADREANGPFASADDLGRVSGIGPKKLEQLKAFVRVQ